MAPREREIEARQLRELPPIYFGQSFRPFIDSSLVRLEEGWQGSVEKPILLKTTNTEALPLRLVLKEIEPADPDMVFQIDGVVKFFRSQAFLSQTRESLLGSGKKEYGFTKRAKEYLRKLGVTIDIPSGKYVDGGVYKGFANQDLLDGGVFTINTFIKEGEENNFPSVLQFPGVDFFAHKNLKVKFLNLNTVPLPPVYENTVFNFSSSTYQVDD